MWKISPLTLTTSLPQSKKLSLCVHRKIPVVLQGTTRFSIKFHSIVKYECSLQFNGKCHNDYINIKKKKYEPVKLTEKPYFTNNT